jgi:hypothetical protein
MFSMQRKQQKCASRLSLNAISVKFGHLRKWAVPSIMNKKYNEPMSLEEW